MSEHSPLSQLSKNERANETASHRPLVIHKTKRRNPCQSDQEETSNPKRRGVTTLGNGGSSKEWEEIVDTEVPSSQEINAEEEESLSGSTSINQATDSGSLSSCRTSLCDTSSPRTTNKRRRRHSRQGHWMLQGTALFLLAVTVLAIALPTLTRRGKNDTERNSLQREYGSEFNLRVAVLTNLLSQNSCLHNHHSRFVAFVCYPLSQNRIFDDGNNSSVVIVGVRRTLVYQRFVSNQPFEYYSVRIITAGTTTWSC